MAEEKLTILGNKVGGFDSPEEAKLESFDNPKPERNYLAIFDMPNPEMMCNCPKTSQPDFYRIKITYCPNKLCLEAKSLKLYLQSFKYSGAFCERLINRITDDIVEAIKPKWIEVRGKMVPRGGIDIETVVTCGEKPKL